MASQQLINIIIKATDEASAAAKKVDDSLRRIGNTSSKLSRIPGFDSLKSKIHGVYESLDNKLGGALTRVGGRFSGLKNTLVSFGSSIKGKLGGALTNVKGKLSNLVSQSKATGAAFSFLGGAASMLVGMIGFNLVNSFVEYGRAAINAEGQLKYFAQRLNMSASESREFNATLEQMQTQFRKVDMKAVGASAEEMAVKLGLPKQALGDLTKATAVMSSAFVKEGRSQEDAILAVSDAMDGQFRRLQELGITQEMLMANGWSGDINDKIGLLKAMNITLDEMGFTETAQDITSLDEAFQALGVAGGQLLASILIPITPALVSLAEGAMHAFDQIKQFITALVELFTGSQDSSGQMDVLNQKTNEFSGKMNEAATAINPFLTGIKDVGSAMGNFKDKMSGLKEAFKGLPDWAQLAIGVIALTTALGLLGTAIWTMVIPPIISAGVAIWGALSPLLPFIAIATAVVVAIYEIGKAFGWWSDVHSMVEALRAGIMKLWDAFINSPHVQATIEALAGAWDAVCDALQPVIEWAQQVWQELIPPGTNFDIVQTIINLFGWLGDKLAWLVGFVRNCWDAFNNFREQLGPFGDSLLLIGSPLLFLISIFLKLWGVLQNLGPIIQRVKDWFSDTFGEASASVSGYIDEIISYLQPLIDFLKELGGFLIGEFMASWNAFMEIINVVSSSVGQLVNIFQMFMDGQISLTTALSMIWNVISTMFMTIFNIIIQRVISFGQNLVNFARTAGNGFLMNIISFFQQLPGRIYAFLVAGLNYVRSTLSQWVNTARQKASQLVTGVVSYITQLPGRVYSLLLGVAHRVASALQNAVNQARAKAQAIVDGVVGTLSGIAGRISGVLGGVVEAVVAPFRNAYNTAKGWWDKIANMASRLSFGGYDLPEDQQIDLFPAYGGYDIDSAVIKKNNTVTVNGGLSFDINVDGIPEGMDQENVESIFQEMVDDPSFKNELIRYIVGSRLFQTLDTKEKDRLLRMNSRARGV